MYVYILNTYHIDIIKYIDSYTIEIYIYICILGLLYIIKDEMRYYEDIVRLRYYEEENSCFEMHAWICHVITKAGP